MSISTGPLIAGDSLQRMQFSQQPARSVSATLWPAGVKTDVLKPPAADVKVGQAGALSTEQIQQSLREINKVLTGLSISVRFQVDPKFKEVIIKVVDQDNGRVIRQIPTEDVVRIAKAMDDLTGLLLAKKA